MVTPTGRRGLVIGAAQGIGRAVAERLARDGDTLLLADVSPAVDDLAESLGASAIHLDVTDPAAPGQLVDAIAGWAGTPDVIVSCAGIQRRGSVLQLPEADWEDLHATNFDGIRRVTTAVVTQMLAEGRPGAIVTVSSSSVASITPGIIPYSIMKAALAQWTRGLAVELGPAGIRVNAVAPGYIRTAMTAPVLDDPSFLGLVRARVPLGDVAAPEAVADPIAFLLSDAARYVSGVILAVDGGYALGSVLPPAPLDSAS